MFMGLWIVVAVIVVVLLVASQDSTSGGQRHRGSSARQILDERLASGELTPDEHAARSAVLGVDSRSRFRWSLGMVVGLGVAAVVLVAAAVSGSNWDTTWMGGHMGWGTSSGTDAAPYPDSREVTVEAGDVWFEPDQVEIAAGEEVNLRVVNSGDAFHDLTIPAADVQLDVAAGDEVVGGLRLEDPGTYEFFCSVPGHAAAGMTGTITVTE